MGSSSLTRDQTQAPCMGAWSLSHWTARKVHIFFIRLLMIMCFVSTFWLWWIMFLQLLLCSCKNFKSESCSVVSGSFWPRGLYSPWNSPGQNTGVGSFPSPGDLPNPWIKPRPPALQVDSLPTEPPGKPKSTGVGILSLLQQIFLIQESNRGLLHCRWILYQLSCEGSNILWIL